MNVAERLFGAVQHLLPNAVSNGIVKAYSQAQSVCVNGLRGMHSASAVHAVNDGLTVRVMPALADNYMYLVVDEASQEAAVVDPVAPATVLATASELGVRISTVLTTHHHWDHAGGNDEFLAKFALANNNKNDLVVVGGDERIGGLNKKVGEGDVLSLGNIRIRCLSTPCHTSGHICYFVTTDVEESNGIEGSDVSKSTKRAAVFTGDTLFLGGCGRFFEGTGEQMHDALINKLSKLPDNTLVFGGHEYSVSNMKFAKHVEPDNDVVQAKLRSCVEKRATNPPTPCGPSTIGEEKQYNPFMRVTQPSLQAAVGKNDPVEAMTALRAMKDKFKAK